MYDQMFRNAQIIDGTGDAAYIGDVAITGGCITEVGKVEGKGAVETDCTGLVLSPGFIDVHTHSDSQLYTDPSRACKLRMGVTTEIGGQCGWSRGPADTGISKAANDYLQSIMNSNYPLKLHASYSSIINDLSHRKLGTSQMAFVGHNMLRASVMGMDDRKPTASELERMKILLDEAMTEGAPGLSTGLVYAPGCYTSTEEIIELAKVVAKHGGIYTTHMRDEASGLVESVRETVRIAEEAGVRANISHLKVQYSVNSALLDEAVAIIDRANASGADISFDVYPYDACSATMLATLPPSYLTHDIDWLVEHLSGNDNIKALEKAIYEPVEKWSNSILDIGYDNDMIAAAVKTPDAVGKTVHQYALEKGVKDIEAYAYILAENRGRVTDIRFVMDESQIAGLYKHPRCMVGTDGLYKGMGEIAHPRAFGTFTRYLGRYVRDKGLLPFEEGVRRITGMVADQYNVPEKGYIKAGHDADLVLFDRESIIDRADYTDPFKPNVGIKAVFVAGQAAVVDNTMTGVMNGRFLTPNY